MTSATANKTVGEGERAVRGVRFVLTPLLSSRRLLELRREDSQRLLLRVDFVLDLTQFFLSVLQLLFSLLQRQTLGFDLEEDFVEGHYVDGPRAETGGGERLAAHDFLFEVLALQHWVAALTMFSGMLSSF